MKAKEAIEERIKYLEQKYGNDSRVEINILKRVLGKFTSSDTALEIVAILPRKRVGVVVQRIVDKDEVVAVAKGYIEVGVLFGKWCIIVRDTRDGKIDTMFWADKLHVA